MHKTIIYDEVTEYPVRKKPRYKMLHKATDMTIRIGAICHSKHNISSLRVSDDLYVAFLYYEFQLGGLNTTIVIRQLLPEDYPSKLHCVVLDCDVNFEKDHLQIGDVKFMYYVYPELNLNRYRI